MHKAKIKKKNPSCVYWLLHAYVDDKALIETWNHRVTRDVIQSLFVCIMMVLIKGTKPLKVLLLNTYSTDLTLLR